MMVLLVVVFYFFLIRPQSKKQKETQKMLDALKKGDKVVTIGGIHGVVSSVDEKNVIVKVDDTTKIKFTRSSCKRCEKIFRRRCGKIFGKTFRGKEIKRSCQHE